MAGMSDNDVVENLDLQKLARSDEIAGNFDVRLGWSRLTAGMVVRNDDCGGTRHDCQTEYLAGMAKNGIHRANGHQIVTLDTPTSVEDEYHQTFTFRIEVGMCRDVRPPISRCLVRCFALLHRVGCGTFPK